MFQTVKKTFVFCFKLTLIFGIFGFLFWNASKATDANGKNVFELLWEQPKNWELLVTAFFAQLFAVTVTILRWRCLVRTLGLVLSVKDAFRLGFLGLMLNLAPMGIVGGDLVKGYLIAKKNPDYMSQAIASVIVDRIIGLLVMFLCGTIFVLATGFAFRQEILARTFSQLVFILTGIGGACVGIVFLPFFSKGHLERLLAKIPFCGDLLEKLTRSFLLYRNHKICLLKTFAITFLVHIPFGISLYLIAKGLFGSVPNLIDHIMLYNVVNLTAMIPLAAGPFEFVLEQIYPLFSVDGTKMGVGIGLVVALGYRLISILVAGLGIAYYLSSRNEIRKIAG
ncbi:MAG: flippase-like domain-containing protein [Planctomycetaceae bacterium]|jgi:uncharacterized protein (TIRG00374 family)|nr:flippase-like domain-containing protein [Planctomycetaceae bacterium]